MVLKKLKLRDTKFSKSGSNISSICKHFPSTNSNINKRYKRCEFDGMSNLSNPNINYNYFGLYLVDIYFCHYNIHPNLITTSGSSCETNKF